VATIVQDIVLKHRANLGEETRTLEFSAGTSVEILQEWSEYYLCKDERGFVFNIERRYVDPA